MTINDYGNASQKLNSPSLADWATSVAAALNNSDVTVDSRVSSAVSAHQVAAGVHSIASTTGLQTALDGKAAASHTHTIANVTALQTALDGKSATTHNHDSAYLSPSEVLAGTNVTVDTTTTPGSVIINSTATGGGGVTDHGALTGLSDDDHSAIYANYVVSASAPASPRAGTIWIQP